MKKFYFLLAATLFAANACDDPNSEPLPLPKVSVFQIKDRLPEAETAWTGDESGTKGVNDYGDDTYVNSFASDNGFFVFNNSYSVSPYYTYWTGFGYTNTSDVTTGSYTNTSAITGTRTGTGQSGNWAFAYLIADAGTPSFLPTITFADGEEAKQLIVFVTNATYTYLSMKNGDGFAKKFGGESGNDPDWLKLTATGYDKLGQETGSADFYLADFRSSDNAKDYIVNEWKKFDLSSLGEVASVTFSLSSSDSSDWGMNTPAIFCMDGLIATPLN